MCGIFALLNYQPMSVDDIKNQFLKGHRRGPEFSKLEFSYFKMVLGFRGRRRGGRVAGDKAREARNRRRRRDCGPYVLV